MALRNFTVRAPASTSNLGPGFDAFGLALNLWNEADFSFDAQGFFCQTMLDNTNKWVFSGIF